LRWRLRDMAEAARASAQKRADEAMMELLAAPAMGLHWRGQVRHTAVAITTLPLPLPLLLALALALAVALALALALALLSSGCNSPFPLLPPSVSHPILLCPPIRLQEYPFIRGDLPPARAHFAACAIGDHLIVSAGAEPTCLRHRPVDAAHGASRVYTLDMKTMVGTVSRCEPIQALVHASRRHLSPAFRER
jgi:hypothetical protein